MSSFLGFRRLRMPRRIFGQRVDVLRESVTAQGGQGELVATRARAYAALPAYLVPVAAEGRMVQGQSARAARWFCYLWTLPDGTLPDVRVDDFLAWTDARESHTAHVLAPVDEGQDVYLKVEVEEVASR